MIYCDIPWYILWYTVVYCDILWYTVVYCGLLWYTVVYCGLLWFTVVYCGILWFTVVYCGILWFTVKYYFTVWHVMFYSEVHSRFYASQIVLAFEYLHHLDIVYRYTPASLYLALLPFAHLTVLFLPPPLPHRDLKPENILIDQQGYVKVS